MMDNIDCGTRLEKYKQLFKEFFVSKDINIEIEKPLILVPKYLWDSVKKLEKTDIQNFNINKNCINFEKGMNFFINGIYIEQSIFKFKKVKNQVWGYDANDNIIIKFYKPNDINIRFKITYYKDRNNNIENDSLSILLIIMDFETTFYKKQNKTREYFIPCTGVEEKKTIMIDSENYQEWVNKLKEGFISSKSIEINFQNLKDKISIICLNGLYFDRLQRIKINSEYAEFYYEDTLFLSLEFEKNKKFEISLEHNVILVKVEGHVGGFPTDDNPNISTVNNMIGSYSIFE